MSGIPIISPLVTPYHTTHLLPPISCLLSPVSHLPSPVSLLPSPVPHLSPPNSHLHLPSLVSLLPSLFHHLLSPLFLVPAPLETPIARGSGEVDCQQEGWKMTTRWGGVRLATSRGGR